MRKLYNLHNYWSYLIMRHFKIISLITVTCLSVILCGCREPVKTTVSTVAPASTAPVQQPIIISFEAEPAEISSGKQSTITWKVSGAIRVEINQGIGTVAQAGSIQVSPADRTLYTIIASNSGGSATRTLEITVPKNLKAKPIALSMEEMEPQGYVFEMNSEPSAEGAISTYYIRFLKGRLSTLMIDNTIYIYNTVAEAEKVFAEDKHNSRMYVANFATVGTQAYYLEIKGNPSEPLTYSLRFQKNNVYVKMVSNLSWAELEAFARILEKRIY